MKSYTFIQAVMLAHTGVFLVLAVIKWNAFITSAPTTGRTLLGRLLPVLGMSACGGLGLIALLVWVLER